MIQMKTMSKAEKTQKSHAVLGEGDWIGMRDCLLPMAWNFAVKTVLHDVRGAGSIPGEAPPRTVLTQVSLAIAALACKMPNWDERAVVRGRGHAQGALRGPGGAAHLLVRLVHPRGGR